MATAGDALMSASNEAPATPAAPAATPAAAPPPAAAAAAAPRRMRDVVNSLPDADRHAVVTEFATLFKESEDSKLKIAALTKDLEAEKDKKDNSEAAVEVLKEQVDLLRGNVGKHLTDVYQLDKQGALESASGAPEGLRMAAFSRRLLCAANDTIMQLRARADAPPPAPVAESSANKRKASELESTFEQALAAADTARPVGTPATLATPAATTPSRREPMTAAVGDAGPATGGTSNEAAALVNLHRFMESKFMQA